MFQLFRSNVNVAELVLNEFLQILRIHSLVDSVGILFTVKLYEFVVIGVVVIGDYRSCRYMGRR